MKPGARALGIAESYTGERSTLAGVLMTASGRVDGFAFGWCTVGGTDATDGMLELLGRLDREDVRAVLVAGVALAWYNMVDLERLADAAAVPVIAVTFEESEGLEGALESAFTGAELADRLERYRALPPRRALRVDGATVYVRSVGSPADRTTEIVRAHTPDGGARPEPLRVANLAARAVDEVGP